MKDNTPFLISGKQRPNSPGSVSPQRYQFLSLKDAEPNVGVPLTNALPASATWVLTTDAAGNRYFATTILSDSTYTTLKNTSGNYVSVFNTTQSNSGKWESTYTTLRANSGTWLTVASASSLYYKSSGGDLQGSMNIFGNVLIYGSLSALSGLQYISTKATTTSSLSIINIGYGPALYVEQDGFYDIARFVDKEGGIVLNVGNVTPPAPGTAGGVVGIRTSNPNHTLTVVGTFSASSNMYTDGIIISAGVPLDTIIFNAIPPALKSVVSTVSVNSAKWESSYSYLNSNSANLVTFQLLSTTPVTLSAANILGNVNIFGNLFAAGSAFFANTVITTTSALSVINVGPGPALFVSQGRGIGNIAAFYDADTAKEVLHVGNSSDPAGNEVDGVIGIKTSVPNKTLTVVGEISATGNINDLTVNYTQGNVVLGRNTTILSFGYDNVFIGRDAATINSFGINNVFIGARAGHINTLGNNNVFVGQNAGQGNSIGSGNVAVGTQAGTNIQTSNNNCIVGNYAGSSITLGGSNTILGDSAGINLVVANFSICIGQGAGTTGDYSRVVAIGPNARASEDFQFVAGASIEQGGFPFSQNSRYYGHLNFTGRLSANSMITNGLTALGYVGIGTSSPARLLTVDNITNPEIGLYTAGTERVKFSTGGSALSQLVIDTAGTARFIIDSGGNVGVGGGAAPTAQVTIAKVVNLAALPSVPANHSISLYPPTTTGYYGGGISWSEGNNTAASICAVDGGSGGALGLVLSTGNNTTITERLRIDSSGNVGIGETTPSYKMEIATSQSYLALKLKDPSTAADFGPNLRFQTKNASGLYWDSGTITSRNASASMTAGAEASYMAFYTTNAGTEGERLRITAASDITSTLPIRYAGNPSNGNDLTRSSYITALHRWTRTIAGVTLNGTAALQKIAADTTAGAFTITLPATPDEGLEIQIVDAGRYSTFNNITIARNGKTINGDADNMLIDKNGAFIILIYLLNDWKVVGVA